MIRRPRRSTLFPYTTLSRSFVIPPSSPPISDLSPAPICEPMFRARTVSPKHRLADRDRKSTRLNSSHQIISYAVFCLKKKNKLGANTRAHLGHYPNSIHVGT